MGGIGHFATRFTALCLIVCAVIGVIAGMIVAIGDKNDGPGNGFLIGFVATLIFSFAIWACVMWLALMIYALRTIW